MKIVKRIVIVLVVIVLLGGIGGFFYFKNKFMGAGPNELTLSNFGKPFDFVWGSFKVNDRIEPNAFMFVPVTIPGVDRTFHMQFDTGAPSTVFLYGCVQDINEKYGDIFQLDTVDNQLQVTNASFKVGTVNLEASKLFFRGRSNKIDWSDTTSTIKIGTIGSDFIEKHPLIIDYKNQKITLAESVPGDIEEKADFLSFTFDGRKVFLSAKLNNEPASLWFDSGSSAFELIVEESTFLELAKPGAERETFVGHSWGKGVTVHNIASNGVFQFGSVSVPLSYVTYMEWPNKLQAFIIKASNVGGDLGGMTGILDTPNLRYTVIE
jgi:hypothetical protein